MSSMKSNFGGASILVKIRPISETTPSNPRVAPDIQSFLSMMEKASICGKDLEFSQCLSSFLEEVDQYLDDGRLAKDEPMDSETVEEMEKFMNEHLPGRVKRNLRKLKEE